MTPVVQSMKVQPVIVSRASVASSAPRIKPLNRQFIMVRQYTPLDVTPVTPSKTQSMIVPFTPLIALEYWDGVYK